MKKKNLQILVGICLLFSLVSVFYTYSKGTSARLYDSKSATTSLVLTKGNVKINEEDFSSIKWRYIGKSNVDNFEQIANVSDTNSYINRETNADLMSSNDILLGANVLVDSSFKNIDINDTFFKKLSYQYVGMNTAVVSVNIDNLPNLSSDFAYFFKVYATTKDNQVKSDSINTVLYNNSVINEKIINQKSFDIKPQEKINIEIKVRSLKGEQNVTSGDSSLNISTNEMNLKVNIQNKLVSK